jgi:Holliday junction resolvasome RuvABC endonuclease subunit
MTVTDTLEHLRSRLQTGIHVMPPREPPQFTDFARDVYVLGFDAALRHTGWIKAVWYSGASLPAVLARGTINLKTDVRGYMGTWDLALQLHDEITSVWAEHHRTGDPVALEAPPVGGGYRTESSLMAGFQVYDISNGNVHVLAANHVSSVLVGNPYHDKAEIAAAVLRYFPESGSRTWSEHQRDAAAVVVTLLYDLAHGNENS